MNKTYSLLSLFALVSVLTGATGYAAFETECPPEQEAPKSNEATPAGESSGDGSSSSSDDNGPSSEREHGGGTPLGFSVDCKL